MIKDRYFEATLGLATIIVAIFFASYVFVKTKSSINKGSSYFLFAKFSDCDGIDIGSAVKISGLKVGEVEDIFIDKGFMSVVQISLNSDIKLPNDSSLSVATSGLIGSKYLMIAAGSDDEMLKAGEYFQYTQSSINVEGLIKKFATK